jgi:ribosomal protein S11
MITLLKNNFKRKEIQTRNSGRKTNIGLLEARRAKNKKKKEVLFSQFLSRYTQWMKSRKKLLQTGFSFKPKRKRTPSHLFSFSQKEKKTFFLSRIRYPEIIIRSNYGNSIITILNPFGKVIRSFSCGHLGFKKAKRSSYYASLQLGFFVGNFIKKTFLVGKKPPRSKFLLRVRGFGFGKKAALKGLRSRLRRRRCFLSLIFDAGVPHNGCRVRKKKRK